MVRLVQAEQIGDRVEILKDLALMFSLSGGEEEPKELRHALAFIYTLVIPSKL